MVQNTITHIFLLDAPSYWKVYNIIMKTIYIGDVAKRFDLNPRTIRYYETFGLLPQVMVSSSPYFPESSRFPFLME